jgi:hypothetical protein
MIFVLRMAGSSPDRLICNDDFIPVFDLIRYGLQLLGNNLDGLVRLPLL